MDFPKKFEIAPFPIEKEFKISSVRSRLRDLSREELEDFLSEALMTMAKLAHQVTQLRDFVEQLEGKTEQL